MQRRFVGLLGSLTLLSALAMVAFIGIDRASAEEGLGRYTRSEPLDATTDLSKIHPVAVDIVAPYALDEAERAAGADQTEEDPWEGFNDAMFTFNRQVLDRFLLKPAGTLWDVILPDAVQRSLKNALDNLAVVRRLVNNVFQLKMGGAGREVARFTINSTIGLAGLFDVAKDGLGIQQSDEDTGQTFGVWGIGPGPYLILPFLPPMTVRDGIGMALDAAMTPYVYFAPIAATAGVYGTTAVNERSLNLERYERVEETVVDLYSAVRNAYLQRRAAAIKE